MRKTGLFYSFNAKKTSFVAEQIVNEFDGEKIDAINADTVTPNKFQEYDNLILGVPTWFDGELPGCWDEFVPAIEDMDLKGKRVAIFGNGDQKGYPENFVDAIGLMAEILEAQGAVIVGLTDNKGYTFESSKAVRGDKLLGLALDFENQKSKNNERIKKWCLKIKEEFTK